MPTPEEVSAWSFDEILAEIQVLLPAGSRVTSVSNPDGYWTVLVEHETPDGPEVDLREVSPDRRLAALAIFGQLWFRNAPQPGKDSPWQRRNELPRAAVPSKAHPRIPDPEDLDPVEVEMVYQDYLK